MATGLSGCALQNKHYKDDALNSTYEISKAYRMDNKSLVMNKPENQRFEFHRSVEFNSSAKLLYISQESVEDRRYLKHLIARSKETGIETFVIDLQKVTNAYEKNILLVKNSGIRYVARIVLFPNGADNLKMKSEAYWLSRYRLVDAAMHLGADEIQLDYLKQNDTDEQELISWFTNQVGAKAKLNIKVTNAT